MTTTSLAVTSNGVAVTSVKAGSIVTLTATVEAGTTAVKQGQVNFCDATAAYCTDIHILATAQLTSSGTATYKFRPGIGSHSYKPVFVGTTSYAGSVSSASPLCARSVTLKATKTDQALLSQARGKYDSPFKRSLQSFDCAVDFSWKEHFTETTRVGDEGTVEELENIFQPIQNRVTVTQQSVTVSSGLTDDAEAKLPHGGMAEGC